LTAIREFIKVKNHELYVKLPEDFDYEEVEVIIMPKQIFSDDLSHLSQAVKDGIDSELSSKSHEEIFSELKAKYAN
jgi:hypothetical protein